ncbi:LAME_0G11210g1_1 [Lachancea meyersii CBS 8951]|uniref:LAME_0G11210g1_1 n=1 Tax=Lachancea meyersii CBS 8951 TaxID=1266667 RepID=A0A1G4K9B3_9SACH|nr:LAME_0G11210g1_1 [Lachancea meyersii CBS 8951]
MSFSTKNLSPLDGLRRNSEDIGATLDQHSDVLVLRERENSIISLESTQTTERLLDRLELSADDEALLEQALKEAENRRIEGFNNSDKRAICAPASGFPSLRKTSASSSHTNGSDFKPLFNILSELSEKEKIILTRKKEVELHCSGSRYSYFVEEDSDEGPDGSVPEYLLSSEGRAINFEKYRTRAPVQNSVSASASQTPEPISIAKVPAMRSPMDSSRTSASQHSGQILLSNSSPAGSKHLIKRTQSSTESMVSGDLETRAKTFEDSPRWKFITPKKSAAPASAYHQNSQSPSKGFSENSKGHKKKPSFFFKNLFKSPKVGDSRSAPSKGQSNESTPPSTPTASQFRFPPLQLDDVGTHKFYTNAPATASSENAPRPFLSRDQHFDHNRASSDTNVYFSRRTEFANSKRIAPDVIGFDTKHNVDLIRPRTHEAVTKPLYKDYLSNPEARIRMVIDLRNRGNLKESTEHLKALCEMQNPTGFLLFGLALRFGSGVKKDYRQSFQYLKKAADVHCEEKEVFRLDIDPFKLTDVPHVPPEPRAPALYECGMSYLKGYGVEEVDEVKGLKYLEKAAALGHLDSMCLSGTVWSKSSKIRRKNKARAAAWFRLADRRGADLIGADWIYKDKYQSRSIDSL